MKSTDFLIIFVYKVMQVEFQQCVVHERRRTWLDLHQQQHQNHCHRHHLITTYIISK